MRESGNRLLVEIIVIFEMWAITAQHKSTFNIAGTMLTCFDELRRRGEGCSNVVVLLV